MDHDLWNIYIHDLYIDLYIDNTQALYKLLWLGVGRVLLVVAWAENLEMNVTVLVSVGVYK